MVREPSLTVHLFVGFRYAAERIFLDHRVHAGQRTEFQCVLRIFRCAGIPGSADRLLPTISLNSSAICTVTG